MERSDNMEQFIADNQWLILITLLWVLPWKGYALWIASKREDKWWFIALFLLNTLAILEIIYLFFVAKILAKKKAGPENTAEGEE